MKTARVLLLLAGFLAVPVAVAQAPAPPELRWGGDAEGGEPFVAADPADPSKVRGFDVEIAEALAKDLGRTARFVQVAYSSIDASVARGDFDVGLSGVELTPARGERLAVTVPYYEFREVLAVRAADTGRFRSLAELSGRRVGTLGGTIAYDLLLEAEKEQKVVPVSYDDDVHPYGDLAQGRLDAVLLDHVLAERAMRREKGLAIQPVTVATGYYVGVVAKGNEALRDRVDATLKAMMRDGRLEAIFRRWHVWDEGQRAHFVRVLAGTAPAATASAAAPGTASPLAQAPAAPRRSILETTVQYLPSLLRAAVVTLLLSCFAMALAVGAGVAIATGRVYGTKPVRILLQVYVEVTRGTPVLLQLFVIYYGLSAWVRLDAFVAALLGLGLNYAAYESEIYRSALESIPAGQLEAARTLGFTEGQVLRLVRAPQAFRLALAPMTNDFVALLKDSSLVSVITVVELTKQTSIFAANVGSWVVPGTLCAALYLALSLPLARVARVLEQRWRVEAR